MLVNQGSFHGTAPQTANTMNQVRADTALKHPLQNGGYNINIHERLATANVIVTDACIPPISQQS